MNILFVFFLKKQKQKQKYNTKQNNRWVMSISRGNRERIRNISIISIDFNRSTKTFFHRLPFRSKLEDAYLENQKVKFILLLIPHYYTHSSSVRSKNNQMFLVFSVLLPCSGNSSGVASFSIGLLIETHGGKPLPGTPLRLRLRKECAERGKFIDHLIYRGHRVDWLPSCWR